MYYQNIYACRIEFHVVCSSNVRDLDHQLNIEIEEAGCLEMEKRCKFITFFK